MIKLKKSYMRKNFHYSIEKIIIVCNDAVRISLIINFTRSLLSEKLYISISIK